MIAAAVLLRDQIMTAAAGLLVKQEAPVKADAIVVLGGDDYGTRVIKAAELAKQGFATKVWVSGPINLMGHESDMTIAYAKLHGFAENTFAPIWLPASAGSTRGEASVIGNELQAKGVKTILLVTSVYHTRRADYLWRKEVPWLRVTVVGAPDPYFTTDGWWKTRPGQKTFLMESVKAVVSHLGD